MRDFFLPVSSNQLLSTHLQLVQQFTRKIKLLFLLLQLKL